MPAHRTIQPRDCPTCGRTFRPNNNRQRYCSNPCARRGMWAVGGPRRKEVTMACAWCGKEWQSTRPTQEPKTCSRACSYALRSGPGNGNWNNGQHTMPDGRVILHLGRGKLKFRARAVMESVLGRELTSEDIVHHINGDPSDDRPENLRVVTRAEHIELHRSDLLAAKARQAALA